MGVPILVSTVFASLVGIVSAVLPVLLLGAPLEIAYSLAPKSVTTAIAIGISDRIGGLPSLTAVVVILTGILGAVIGPALLTLVRVTNRVAFGFAIGAAAHGVGTARALEIGDVEGASGGLAICLTGIVTAVAAPWVVKLLYAVFS